MKLRPIWPHKYYVPPSFIFVPPSPSFKWVRLGVEARGPSVASREGEKGTKMKGGGGGTINSIMGKSLKILPESRFYLRTKRIPEVDSVGQRVSFRHPLSSSVVGMATLWTRSYNLKQIINK